MSFACCRFPSHLGYGADHSFVCNYEYEECHTRETVEASTKALKQM